MSDDWTKALGAAIRGEPAARPAEAGSGELPEGGPWFGCFTGLRILNMLADMQNGSDPRALYARHRRRPGIAPSAPPEEEPTHG